MGLTERFRRAKDDLRALSVALRHPRTPWYAKAWLLLVVAYAVSPIDLIPDPIPVLGLLDDAILLPLGVLLALRMIPEDVLEDCRAAPVTPLPRSVKVVGITLVLALWIAFAIGVWSWIW